MSSHRLPKSSSRASVTSTATDRTIRSSSVAESVTSASIVREKSVPGVTSPLPKFFRTRTSSQTVQSV